MIRGILAGGLWGAFIGAVVLALTSQLADWRDLTPAVTAEDSGNDTAPAAPVTESDRPPSVTAAAERAPRVAAATPQVDAGAADEITAPMLDTAPPSAPQAGAPRDQVTAEVDASQSPAAPAPVETPASTPPSIAVASVPETDTPPSPGEPALAPASSAPDALAEVDAPGAPNPVSDAPEVVAEDAPAVVADAPQTAALVTQGDAQPSAPKAPAPIEAEAEPEQTSVPEVAEASDAPAPEEAERPEPVVVARATIPEASDEAPSTDMATPARQPAPAAVSEPAVAPREDEAPDVADAPTEATPEPIVTAEATAPREAEATPSIDAAPPANAPTTAGHLDDGASGDTPQFIDTAGSEPSLPGRRVTGLPRISAVVTDETDEAEEVASDEAPDSSTASQSTALDRNRIAFEAPEGAGLIAVVLIHEGGPALDIDAGAGLPITVAIPASLPDASDVAKAYRAAGHEVALIPDLPTNAAAQDVEVALPVNFAAVPDAVAIMDAGGAGFQNDRATTSSVIAAVVESGHGLLTWPKGFNSAQRMADQEGVPSALVFRQLEAGDADSIGRVLDQAAFRARQEGGVVLAGPAEASIIGGLQTWAVSARRADTALAPLSAILSGR